MTRQRRSHLMLIALVPVVAFTAVRCADSPTPLPSAPPPSTAPSADITAKIAKLHEKTDWIGQFHNDALAYVYASMSRLPAKARDKHTICEAARRAYAEFHRARRGSAVPASVDAEMEQFCATGSFSASRAAVIPGAPTPGTKEISPAAQTLMDQIATAVDASTSYPEMSGSVNSIEAQAASSLSEEDAAGVFTVGSVALSSAGYWANNVTEWVPFTNTPDYALLSSRSVVANPLGPPVLVDGGGGFGWGDWATSVWNDTKRAAKRAAAGDIHAAAKAVVGAAVASGPLIMDLVLGAAAAGSIFAVLQFSASKPRRSTPMATHATKGLRSAPSSA
jgi:hypothetical protein